MSAQTVPNAAPRRLDDVEEARQARFSIRDSDLLKMLWRFMRPYRWHFVGVFALLLAVSALSVLLPYLIQLAVDGPITSGDLDGMLPLGLGYIGSILLIFILRFAYTYWLQTIGQSVLVTLRQTLFEHILRQDISYFNHTPVGKLTSRLSNDIEALSELVSTSFVMVVSNLMTLAGIVLVMFSINWRLAILSLAVLPIMIGMSVYSRRKIRAASMGLHRAIGEYQAYLNEQFNGMLIVQLFNRQARSQQEFEAINRSYFDAHVQLRDAFTWYASALLLLTTLGLAAALLGGALGLAGGWVTLGMLIAFVEYTRRSFEPINQLAEQFAQIQTAFSAGERLARMFLIEPLVAEPTEPVVLPTFDKTVALEQVTFGYEAEHPVLRDVTLCLRPHERVAIVGATGAGKTSLVKLLARFHDVDAGRVLVGGVDIRLLSTTDLRRYVTVVPQNPYCFNGTIADNLRLFDPAITLAQMEAAARAACAHPFIERLPGGYDYELLPGGGNLSHGQRQLLALARALLHSPDSVLILDEATSNIDTETEVLIQQGLAQVLANRTSLIIAHRLSTVRDADRIIVMQQGRIAEEGTHETLLAQGGLYAGLYERQFAEV